MNKDKVVINKCKENILCFDGEIGEWIISLIFSDI